VPVLTPQGVRSPARPDVVHAGRATSTVRYRLLLVLLLGSLLAMSLLAVGVGAVHVPLSAVLGIVTDRLLPGEAGQTWTPAQERIVWEFRVPRALLAAVVGASLATVGTVLQAVVRNPLADPFLLGVSSGASFGAVVVILLGASAAGGLGLSAAAFAGALLATALVFLAAQSGGRLTPARLVLAGVALAYLFQAAYTYLLQKDDAGRAAQNALFWLLGSLAGARWDTLLIPSLVLALGLLALLTQSRTLNAVLAGDDAAISLGVAVHRFRLQAFLLTSLLTGTAVAASGAIAFVGLIVPHVTRLLVGSDHRRVLPLSALLGAVFLQAVDIAARLLDVPQELPASVVTAALGVPFFLWLLRRRTDRTTIT